MSVVTREVAAEEAPLRAAARVEDSTWEEGGEGGREIHVEVKAGQAGQAGQALGIQETEKRHEWVKQ
jgi:hypothetical protein